MKAITIAPTSALNPAWDIAEFRKAKAEGKVYIEREIAIPIGTVIEHPLVWLHCCRPKPVMAPVDDECTAKVEAFLNHPRRKALLAQFKHMSTPAVLAKLPKGLQDFVRTMATRWAAHMHDVEPDTSATADKLQAVMDASVVDSDVLDDEADDDYVASDGTFGGL